MEAASRELWNDYAQRKRAERIAEAGQVWAALVGAGGNADTVLAVDFVHFGPTRNQVEELGRQLAESYTCTVEGGSAGYWLLKGTTRPYGITLTSAEHVDWVGFMCDVGASHGCTFSTWSLSAPSLSFTVSSESFES